MTLLVTVFAAAISTIIWYKELPKKSMRIGNLCLIYWGASLMWMVDAVHEYVVLGENYFHPAFEDLVNDAFLGFSVVAVGLVIWIVMLLVEDPKGVIKMRLKNRIE